jgi:hypothetical protein
VSGPGRARLICDMTGDGPYAFAVVVDAMIVVDWCDDYEALRRIVRDLNSGASVAVVG